ncbi:hypothetical protein LCGC14_1213560 [marine sediment metagenome]|uniref:Uncharacterized protein n=1 Tax=marine sediment metagenome TaxID=412755 RepID=A0A0F9LDD7_9ZZZZ
MRAKFYDLTFFLKRQGISLVKRGKHVWIQENVYKYSGGEKFQYIAQFPPWVKKGNCVKQYIVYLKVYSKQNTAGPHKRV